MLDRVHATATATAAAAASPSLSVSSTVDFNEEGDCEHCRKMAQHAFLSTFMDIDREHEKRVITRDDLEAYAARKGLGDKFVDVSEDCMLMRSFMSNSR